MKRRQWVRMSPDSEVSVERTALTGGATLVTLRGVKAGPTVALLGGVHGDEDEGVLAVQRVLQELAGIPFTGTLRAVAPVNVLAWGAFSRNGPLDDGNLARSFSGDVNSGPTAELAADVRVQVISGADMLIDLHSAGLRYQMPLFCGFTRGSEADGLSLQAAGAFGVPLVWVHPGLSAGRTLSVAAEQGIPAIYVECSGGGSIYSFELEAYVGGVLSVLAELGMIEKAYRQPDCEQTQYVYGPGDLDHGVASSYHGLFVAGQAAGNVVEAGAEVGRVYGYEGQLLEIIRSYQEGVIMFLRRQARVQIGDVLFVLASVTDSKP